MKNVELKLKRDELFALKNLMKFARKYRGFSQYEMESVVVDANIQKELMQEIELDLENNFHVEDIKGIGNLMFEFAKSETSTRMIDDIVGEESTSYIIRSIPDSLVQYALDVIVLYRKYMTAFMDSVKAYVDHVDAKIESIQEFTTNIVEADNLLFNNLSVKTSFCHIGDWECRAHGWYKMYKKLDSSFKHDDIEAVINVLTFALGGQYIRAIRNENVAEYFSHLITNWYAVHDKTSTLSTDVIGTVITDKHSILDPGARSTAIDIGTLIGQIRSGTTLTDIDRASMYVNIGDFRGLFEDDSLYPKFQLAMKTLGELYDFTKVYVDLNVDKIRNTKKSGMPEGMHLSLFGYGLFMSDEMREAHRLLGEISGIRKAIKMVELYYKNLTLI